LPAARFEARILSLGGITGILGPNRRENRKSIQRGPSETRIDAGRHFTIDNRL
jgi:hypothetical protein